MFWPQPAQLRVMTGWCPCWPNDWSPGSGCPGMIISHITEWEAAVRGRGRWPQVPWQPLAPASAPAHETFTSRPWLPHHPHSADSSPLSTLWYGHRYGVGSTLLWTIPFNFTPLCRPDVDVDNDYLSFIYFSRSEAECKHPELWAAGWETQSRSRRLAWPLAATGAAPGPEPGLLAVDGGPWSLVLAIASQPGTSSPGLMINTKTNINFS